MLKRGIIFCLRMQQKMQMSRKLKNMKYQHINSIRKEIDLEDNETDDEYYDNLLRKKSDEELFNFKNNLIKDIMNESKKEERMEKIKEIENLKKNRNKKEFEEKKIDLILEYFPHVENQKDMTIDEKLKFYLDFPILITNRKFKEYFNIFRMHAKKSFGADNIENLKLSEIKDLRKMIFSNNFEHENSSEVDESNEYSENKEDQTVSELTEETEDQTESELTEDQNESELTEETEDHTESEINEDQTESELIEDQTESELTEETEGHTNLDEESQKLDNARKLEMKRLKDFENDRNKLDYLKKKLPHHSLGFEYTPWDVQTLPFHLRTEGEQKLMQMTFGIVNLERFYDQFLYKMERINFNPKSLLLLDLKNSFKGLKPTSREMDYKVLSEFDLKSSYLPHFFSKIFLDYQKALVSGDLDIIPLNDNFHLASKAQLKCLNEKGVRYQFKEGFGFESEPVMSIKFLEVLHVVGSRVMRRLNTDKKNTIMLNNEYGRGLLVYGLEKTNQIQ